MRDKNLESEKSLHTGAVTLNTTNRPEKQFGIVAAETKLSNHGHVVMFLRSSDVSHSMEDDSIKICLSEEQSIELEKNLSTVNCRLAHLRALYKLGMLRDNAFEKSE